MKKIKIIGLVALSVVFAAIGAFVCSNVINTLAEEQLKVAHHCTFVVPAEFEPSNTEGTFINKNAPMESSSISYSVYYNGKDIVLTNREKLANPESIEAAVIDNSRNMTSKSYSEMISAAYAKEYGQDVNFEVESFNNITIDGYPGYAIQSTFQLPDTEKVYQTVYILLSRYKTYTITYQRAEDDDCAELFEKSAASIHVG